VKHTLQQGLQTVEKLSSAFAGVKLIGSLGKGSDISEHDIDILIPISENEWNEGSRRKAIHLLGGCSSWEVTDWGGWFLHDTPFGEVDIFPCEPTDD
jgi:tRNA nucleotidyltransferase (CCA-adding enzyme)